MYFKIKACTLIFLRHNATQTNIYSYVNITNYVCLLWFNLFTAFLQWSGTKAAVSLRYACNIYFKDCYVDWMSQ